MAESRNQAALPIKSLLGKALVVFLLFAIAACAWAMAGFATERLVVERDIHKQIEKRPGRATSRSDVLEAQWIAEKRAMLSGASHAPQIRTIEIFADQEGFRAEFRLQLALDNPLAAEIAAGDFSDPWSDPRKEALFIPVAFGDVQIDFKAIRESELAGITFTVDRAANQLTALLRVHRSHYAVFFNSGEGLLADTWFQFAPLGNIQPEIDRLIVHCGDHGRLIRVSPVFDNVATDDAQIERRAPDSLSNVEIGLRIDNPRYPPAPAPKPPPEMQELSNARKAPAVASTQDLLRHISGDISIPLVSPILVALIFALPIMLYLRLRRRETEPAELAPLGPLLYALLALHLALALANGCNQLVDAAPSDWFPFSAFFQRWGFPVRSSGLRTGVAAVAVAVVGVLVPAVALARTAHKRARGARAAVVAAGLLIPPAIFWAAVEQEHATVTFFLLALAVTVAAFLVSWCALSWLGGYTADDGRRNWAAGLAASLVAMLMAGVQVLGKAPAWTVFFPAATALLGGYLAYQLWFSVASTLRTIADRPRAATSRTQQIALFSALMALAVPWTIEDGAFKLERYSFTLLSFAWALDRFLPLAFVAAAVVYFYRACRVNMRLHRFQRALAVLAFSTIAYDTNNYWLYIPITFLIGWYALEYFLVRRPSLWEASLRKMLDGDVPDRPEQLERLLDLVAAERANDGFREKTRQRLAAGEITPDESAKLLAERRAQMQALRASNSVGDYSLRDVALAFGPGRTAWGNAMHGLRWGLLFSAPWIALGVHDLLLSDNIHGTYPLWSLANMFVSRCLRWAAIGFFLGFFFPYLPGRSGIQKGFFLFLALMVPILPHAAILDTASGWQALLFLAGQTFIVCMLLGMVAFDYMTLRRGGLNDWRLVFYVHDLPSLGVSISTLLVAIGATATTLLTNQATSLITTGIKLLFGQAPTAPGGH